MNIVSVGLRTRSLVPLALVIFLTVLICGSTYAASSNCFVIVADVQNIDELNRLAKEIIELNPPFVIAAGDMPSAFGPPHFFRQLREAGIEIHIAMGNHDGGSKSAVRSSIPPYPFTSEVDPILRFVVENKYYYSFNRGGIHFVITDTCTGNVNEEIQWLEDDLIHHINNPQRLPSIVFMHYPDWMLKGKGSGGPIYQVLAKYPNDHTVKAGFAGHTHLGINYPLEETLGIPHYAVYASAPFGEHQHTEYIIANVEPDMITFTRKPISDKGEGKDFVIHPIRGNFWSLRYAEKPE